VICEYELVRCLCLPKFLEKLFGKKTKSEDETIAELRATINRLQLRSKELDKRAKMSREQAKKLLRMGNKEGAKFQLKRWFRYVQLFNRYSRQIASLEDAIATIETARDSVEMSKALSTALNALRQAREIASPEKAMELMVRMDQTMQEIESTSQIFSEGFEAAGEEDKSIERELEKLEAEVMLEAAGELPKIPAKTEKVEEIEEEVKKLREETSEEEKEEA